MDPTLSLMMYVTSFSWSGFLAFLYFLSVKTQPFRLFYAARARLCFSNIGGTWAHLARWYFMNKTYILNRCIYCIYIIYEMLPRNISQINNTIDLVESGIFFQVFQLLISPVLNHTHLQLKLLLISRDMMPAIKKHVHVCIRQKSHRTTLVCFPYYLLQIFLGWWNTSLYLIFFSDTLHILVVHYLKGVPFRCETTSLHYPWRIHGTKGIFTYSLLVDFY